MTLHALELNKEAVRIYCLCSSDRKAKYREQWQDTSGGLFAYVNRGHPVWSRSSLEPVTFQQTPVLKADMLLTELKARLHGRGHLLMFYAELYLLASVTHSVEMN